MKIYHHKVDIIVDAPPANTRVSTADLRKQLKQAGIPVEAVIVKKTSLRGAKSKAHSDTSPEKIIVKTGLRDSDVHPWDIAHQCTSALGSTFTEPDLLKEFTVGNNATAAGYKRNARGMDSKKKSDHGFDPDWPPTKDLIWHLSDQFSQLKRARESVMDEPEHIRIAHFDTGYSPTHVIIPETLKKNPLQRSFVDGEDPHDAHDRQVSGTLRMPLHGTGTAGILAGNRIKLQTDDGIFDDHLGGAPFAEIIPCRISNSVILFKTSAFAEALKYITELTLSGTTVHVLSMSMGGAPSKAWVDAVNAAYDAGIIMVTASGNNFNGLPTQHVIYPARFNRVIAACGVTYTLEPYHHTKIGEMQGCYGPQRHMDKAIAAFTPNTPWASGNKNVISFSGAGTSSATPQVAAAAAMYYRKYANQLAKLQPWQRIEAVRHALYTAASKTGSPIGSFQECFGNGILKAYDALSIPVNHNIGKTPPDTMPWFPILTTVFREAQTTGRSSKMSMFHTEIAQLLFEHAELRSTIDGNDSPSRTITPQQWNKLRDALIEHPAASRTLQQYLIHTHTRKTTQR